MIWRIKAVGVPFILGLVIYGVIIFGLTLWFGRYHALKCEQKAIRENWAELANHESQPPVPKPGNPKK